MNLTLYQVAEMAPDSSSASAGKKLMALKNWPELGQSAEALWGKCQGSPGAIAAVASPEWVDEWIVKRKAREEKKSQPQSDEPKKPVDEKAQQRRADQREARVREGLERLDLWINDLVRNGLAGIETKPPSFWEEQAKRLVDAQAPGLASRVSQLAAIPGSSRDWPERLVSEIGRMKLLLRAWQRIGVLDAALASDVRQIIGWNVGQDELDKVGEPVDDDWIVYGQWVDDDGRIRAQRSWLVGPHAKRTALILQFAAGGQPFGESLVPGTKQPGTLVFYPGASRSRAKMQKRSGSVDSVQSRIPGSSTIEEFLSSVTEALARQPWLGALGGVLHDVTLVPENETWFVRDRAGAALPLFGRAHWKTLAVTGGHPFDLTGEWDGYQFRPLGLFVNSQFRVA
jgi:hypothetical protein